MGAAGFIATLIGIAEELPKIVAQKAFDLAFDPAFNEALSPSAGLTVTPLMFSSVEQEGRWKVKEWGFSSFPNEERQLTNRILVAAGSSPIPDPADAPVGVAVGTCGKPSTKRDYGRLLTIDIPKPPDTDDYISAALALISGNALSSAPKIALRQLINRTVLQEGHAEVSADWQHDDLEIWGGFAGLTAAKGFGSVFGHRANVELTGTVYGNYLPGSFLIGMSGYVNPVGPKYVEFRCGAVVQAGKPIQPLWGKRWDRDGNQTDLKFVPKEGFKISL